MALTITIAEQKTNVYLIVLQGSIDSETSITLEEKLKEIISDQTKALILDMGGVNYISSAGIGIIMWTKNLLEEQNASLSMVNLQPKISKIFAVMQLLPILNIFQDMPEADKYIDQIINEEMEREDV